MTAVGLLRFPKEDMGTMNPVERNLVWLGVEDYTGLWQAAIEVRNVPGAQSPHDAREYACHVIESLLDSGWIELYVCQEPLNNESVELVLAEDRSRILQCDSSWIAPEHGKSVRFVTTDDGFDAYTEDR